MTMTAVYHWNDDLTVFDGIGTITLAGTYMQQTGGPIVVRKTALDGGGYEFSDNHGHTLIGVEAINTTGKDDKINVDYSLGEPDMLLSGFLLDIRTYGGNDVVRVGDTMPAGDSGEPRLGAQIVGGIGDDDLTGGKQNDLIYGDTESFKVWKGNDTLRGGGGNDTIFGQLGNDKILGGDGDDVLVGDTDFKNGKDKITGGLGADAIEFGNDSAPDTVFINKVEESTLASFDTIKDFGAVLDTLDLHLIDADTAKGGDQAFRLTDAWTAKGGDLLYEIEHSTMDGDKVTLSGDVDGDNVADLKVVFYVNDGWIDLAGLKGCLEL
jgi:Ca2+-binding RTX toxin-like protein